MMEPMGHRQGPADPCGYPLYNMVFPHSVVQDTHSPTLHAGRWMLGQVKPAARLAAVTRACVGRPMFGCAFFLFEISPRLFYNTAPYSDLVQLKWGNGGPVLQAMAPCWGRFRWCRQPMRRNTIKRKGEEGQEDFIVTVSVLSSSSPPVRTGR